VKVALSRLRGLNMYNIWQKNDHGIYKGIHLFVSAASARSWTIGTISNPGLSLPPPPQLCQRYNNYYTIYYIQQVINKLKVVSASLCVVRENSRRRSRTIYKTDRTQEKRRNELKNKNPTRFCDSYDSSTCTSEAGGAGFTFRCFQKFVEVHPKKRKTGIQETTP